MPWDLVIGQDRLTEALGRAVAQERIAGAYLFYGPEGSGKRAAALAFAQALQCEQRGRGGPEDAACGRCLACTKAVRGLHPDVHVYLPQPNDARLDDLTERLQRMYRNPYEVVDFQRRPSLQNAGKTSSKQVIYSADGIRAVMHDLHYVPGEGRYTVGILLDADRMRVEAANAFLKMLEEPGEQVVLVLTATRTDQMLPTILSRCQRLRFDPLPAEAIEQALVAREQVLPDRAAFVARMADGSYSQALALIESEELAERRQLALDFLRKAYGLDPLTLPLQIEQIGKLGREPVKQLFSLMLGWVRDLVLYRVAGADAPLVNVDQAEAIRSFVTRLPDARLEAMTGLIEEAANLVEGNVHTALVLTVLAQALSAAMRGEDRTRLFAPLAEPAVTV